MFNPLKMNPVEKRILLGGLSNSLIYWANHFAMDTIPEYPQELKNRVEPHMPQNADIITSLAPPATLYVVKKISKSTDRKEKVGDMAFGATLYGVPNFLHDVVVQTAYQEGIAGRPTARLPPTMAMTKYAVNNIPIPRTVSVASMGKYRVTS